MRKAAGIIMTGLGMVWLALFPLWQDLTYIHITKTKWIGALILGGVTVIGAVAALLLRRRVRLHPLHGVAVAYFAWVAVSAWQGSYAQQVNGQGQLAVWMGAVRYEGLLTQLCYGLIFLMMSVCPAKLRPVGYAASAALLVNVVLIAVQYTGIDPLGFYPGGRSIYTNHEFQGTIGNIDMFNGYLSLVTPFLLGLFLQKGHPVLWAGGFLGAVLCWCMEVQSGLIALLGCCCLILVLMLRYPAYRARGCWALAAVALALALRGCLYLPWLDNPIPRQVEPARLAVSGKLWLGLGAAAVCLMLSDPLNKHPGKAVPFRTVLCLTLAAAVLLVAAVAFAPIPESADGLYELHELLNGRGQDSFGKWRLGVWRHTLLMSRDSLLFGTGPDTFLYAMKDHLAAAETSLPENFDNPHNEYLAILSNNGLPALALYLTLLGGTILLSVKKKQWPLVMGLVCYAVHGMFSFSVCLVSPMFWAVMGMAVAQIARKERRHGHLRA